jgi:hypothetical protein
MTPTSSGDESKMYALLRDLSENDNFSKLKVEVSAFTDKISEILIKSYDLYERSNRNIDDYKANQHSNTIPPKINMLNSQIKDNTRPNSSLEISVGRLDNFPVGTYNFILNYSEINPSVITSQISKEKVFKNNSLLKLKEESDVMVLKNTGCENCFEAVNFSALDTGVNSWILERDDYSGTTLSTFFLTIEKDGRIFAQSPFKFLFHTFLNLIDNLEDISKIIVTTPIGLDLEQEIEGNNQGYPKPLSVYLDLKFEFDPLTRASILNRVLYVFKKVLQTRSDNEHIINEILDKYFPEIAARVRQVLSKADEESENKCNCSSCRIF